MRLRGDFAEAVKSSKIKYQIGVRGNKNGSDWHVIDMYDKSDLVDYNYDLQDLPIQNNTVDCYVCNAILEHIPQPELAVYEMYRTLKPGGMIWVEVPFTQPFHAHPYDYSRVTVPGMRRWMKHFDEIAIGTVGNFGSEIRKFGSMLLSYTGTDEIDIEAVEQTARSIEKLSIDSDKFGKFYSCVYFWGKKPEENLVSDVEKAYFSNLKSSRYPDYLRIGNTIDFSLYGFPDAFLGKGWAKPEASGCWTIGEEATLHFHLNDKNACNLRLHLTGETYPGRAGKECLIKIELNNSQIISHRCGSAPNFEFNANFGNELLEEDAELGICLYIDKPLSPLSQGHSNDNRQLGVLLKSLRIEQV